MRAPSALDRVAMQRLASQQIANPSMTTPADVVRWMGAVQAQDYAGTKWAVGLRLARSAGATEATVDEAFAEGSILRTHIFRGTWQLVVPEDLRWMVELVAPRIATAVARRHRELGLDAATLRKTVKVLEKACRAGGHLTRDEAAEALERAGISTEGQRLSHLLFWCELELLLCSGRPRGKQTTWALLDERVPNAKARPRDESVGELVLRYFRSRGPATIEDFVWWTGLTVADAREGLEAAKGKLQSETLDRKTYWFAESVAVETPLVELLPAFDEFLVAYRDRGASLAPEHQKRINAGGGLLRPVVVSGGRVVAAWRRTLQKQSASIELEHLFQPSAGLKREIGRAARRWAEFVGVEVELQ